MENIQHHKAFTRSQPGDVSAFLCHFSQSGNDMRHHIEVHASHREQVWESPSASLWAANEINFPALSVMAWQYLGVLATSASAESLFSLAGRAFDDLRQRMKEEMLEILMWARINKEKRQRD